LKRKRRPSTIPLLPECPCSSPPLTPLRPASPPKRERILGKLEMKPLPPAGSPDRRGKPPPLLSTSSRSAFPTAAVSEHACVRTPVARPMLLLLGRVSIFFLFFSPSSFPLYWLRRVCPDALWCSARAWWPAFRVSRSRCKSGGWQPRKGTTRRSLSPGNSNGKHFFRGEGETRGAISGGSGLSGWQLVSFVLLVQGACSRARWWAQERF